MGPRLNYPKSVTEYWNKKAIKAFILNPSSFRHGVKCLNQQTSTQRYRRNRLLFRIHGKSQAKVRIQFTFRHNNSFSTETLL
jgi:hypothetical protein